MKAQLLEFRSRLRYRSFLRSRESSLATSCLLQLQENTSTPSSSTRRVSATCIDQLLPVETVINVYGEDQQSTATIVPFRYLIVPALPGVTSGGLLFSGGCAVETSRGALCIACAAFS